MMRVTVGKKLYLSVCIILWMGYITNITNEQGVQMNTSHYKDISTNQLFSMFNRTTYAPNKKAIKAELKSRGFFGGHFRVDLH